MTTFSLDLDYELSDDGEMTGRFCVIAIEDDNGNDVSALVDATKFYDDFEQVKSDIAEAKGLMVDDIDLEEMADA